MGTVKCNKGIIEADKLLAARCIGLWDNLKGSNGSCTEQHVKK